jgi:hypothetical protein
MFLTQAQSGLHYRFRWAIDNEEADMKNSSFRTLALLCAWAALGVIVTVATVWIGVEIGEALR